MRADDIVRQRFTKVFRGYDVQEVDLFLDEVIRTLDELERERNVLLSRVEALLNELDRYDALLKGGAVQAPVRMPEAQRVQELGSPQAIAPAAEQPQPPHDIHADDPLTGGAHTVAQRAGGARRVAAQAAGEAPMEAAVQEPVPAPPQEPAVPAPPQEEAELAYPTGEEDVFIPGHPVLEPLLPIEPLHMQPEEPAPGEPPAEESEHIFIPGHPDL